jgi:hypothetical protein
LIQNKKIYLKTVYRDIYKRMISNVYNSDGKYVNAEMIRSGNAILYQTGKPDPDMIEAGIEARKVKAGILGPPCTQSVNIEKPECNIKGNARFESNEKIYHYPGCGQYNNVLVRLYLGDQWFCTEKEAQKAGFRKANLCPLR